MKVQNEQNKGNKERKTFIEPKLIKQESLIKSTLISVAAAPGTAAVNT